jgi:hypothetical protein
MTPPDAVVFAESTPDVQFLIQQCKAFKVPVIAFGAGSSLEGHILAFEGDSQVVWFEGNYQDYEEDRKRRLGSDALQPQRIKYRKLVR